MNNVLRDVLIITAIAFVIFAEVITNTMPINACVCNNNLFNISEDGNVSFIQGSTRGLLQLNKAPYTLIKNIESCPLACENAGLPYCTRLTKLTKLNEVKCDNMTLNEVNFSWIN